MPYEIRAYLLYSLPFTAPLSLRGVMFFNNLSAMSHLHFLIDLLAKQTRRLNEKHNDETSEYYGISQL